MFKKVGRRRRRTPAPDVHGLKAHPLLSLIPQSLLDQLLDGSALLELPKGKVVFQRGDRCDAIYLIMSGRCESRDTLGAVDCVLGPGDILGQRAFLSRDTHRYTVVVATHCVLLRINTSDLLALFEKDPCFAGRFLQALTARIAVVGERTPPKHVERIVAIQSMCEELDDHALVTRLSEELHHLTGRRVLLLHIGPGHEPVALNEWPQIARHHNGSFALHEHTRETGPGIHELHVSATPGAQPAARVPQLLSHCGRHFDYVLLRIAATTPVAPALECLIQSDLALVLVPPGSRASDEFEILMQKLAAQSRGASDHVKPVVIPDTGGETREVAALAGRPVHSYAHGFPRRGEMGDSRFDLHIRRLAREIAHCRIGLALSSGGAKGLAHVGVIQVLEEHGVEVDCVSGASMGAYVGGLWASGAGGSQLEAIAREIETRWGLWSLFDPVLPPRRGFLRTRRVMKRLRRHLGDARFCDMVRPLRVIATNLETLEHVIFSRGDVGNAIEASIAIPGIVVPVSLGGETLIDGGVSDPLPVGVLREAGIERIIAVNVIPPPEKLREWRTEKCLPRDVAAARNTIGAILNRHLNYFAKGNVLDTLLQAISGAQTRVAESAGRKADVLLRPLHCEARWHDFTNPGKYIALGRQVAMAHLPEILALAKGATHEHHTQPALACVA